LEVSCGMELPSRTVSSGLLCITHQSRDMLRTLQPLKMLRLPHLSDVRRADLIPAIRIDHPRSMRTAVPHAWQHPLLHAMVPQQRCYSPYVDAMVGSCGQRHGAFKVRANSSTAALQRYSDRPGAWTLAESHGYCKGLVGARHSSTWSHAWVLGQWSMPYSVESTMLRGCWIEKASRLRIRLRAPRSSLRNLPVVSLPCWAIPHVYPKHHTAVLAAPALQSHTGRHTPSIAAFGGSLYLASPPHAVAEELLIGPCACFINAVGCAEGGAIRASHMRRTAGARVCDSKSRN
jgi:hypothetical protein